MKRAVLLFVVAALVALPGAHSVLGDGSPTPAPAPGPTVAAVGDMVCNSGPAEGPDRDIEKYGECDYRAVSDIVANGDYDAFFALGDLQYLRGGLRKFRTFYDRSYGRVKDVTYPVAGNHEYYTRTNGKWGAGYYAYFGDAAHPPHGYYSFDLGEWHVIVLNTQLCKEKSWLPRFGMIHGLPGDGCRSGDPQYEWLQRDLAAHPASDYPCTMAAFHHPLFKWSYWPVRKTDRVQRPLWSLLQKAGADVVMNGHWHNYQRFEPVNARGEPSDMGMAEFVVGTGGDTHSQLPERGKWNWQPRPAGLQAAQASSYGILQMTLLDDAYKWKFVTAEGQPPYEDEGLAKCH